jgi:purine-binding chemotaxis protein CheW
MARKSPEATKPQLPAKPPAAGLESFFLGPGELGVQAGHGRAVATARIELLLFTLGSEDFALPVPTLREIVLPPLLSEVPRAPRDVMGVTMLRGEVVPVYDPRLSLGLPVRPARSRRTRVVIADSGKGPLGLWVDAVLQVLRVTEAELELPPPGLGRAPAISRLGRHGGRLFAVLELGLLLREGR